MMSPIERFLEAVLAAVGLLMSVLGLGLMLCVGVLVLTTWGNGEVFDYFVGTMLILVTVSSLIISAIMLLEDCTWLKVSAVCEDLICFPFLRLMPGWKKLWTRIHILAYNMGSYGTWAKPAREKSTPHEEYCTHAASLAAERYFFYEEMPDG